MTWKVKGVRPAFPSSPATSVRETGHGWGKSDQTGVEPKVAIVGHQNERGRASSVLVRVAIHIVGPLVRRREGVAGGPDELDGVGAGENVRELVSAGVIRGHAIDRLPGGIEEADRHAFHALLARVLKPVAIVGPDEVTDGRASGSARTRPASRMR
jgi:hypothetical protein